MIDEKKLIEELKKRVRTKRSTMEIIRDIIPLIESQPKVGEWIPCRERLPDESGTYIVNAIENGIVHVTFAKWMPRMKTWNLTGSRSYWRVTAWKPLTEPYKPKGE